jgi:hypothetical protein
VGDNKKVWDSKIKYALWDRITKKSATGKRLFELVYGLDVTLPVHLKLPMYQLLQGFSSDKDAIQNKMNQIIELDETRRKAFNQSIRNQGKVKGPLTSHLGEGLFRKMIWCFYGIREERSRTIMGSLTVYGWGLIKEF